MSGTPNILPQFSDLDYVADIAEFYDIDDDIGLVETDPADIRPYGFTWKFDFSNGDLNFSGGNPPTVQGLETLNEWIFHTINTEQFETPIFGPDIGTNVNSLIGSVIDSYTLSRVKSDIVEAILIHDRVASIDDVVVFALINDVFAYFSYSTNDYDHGASIIQVG